ncbi:MAG: hypothetical protein DI535_20720 [Citrobacter freundii]|nr:MAG: hypothetical protein DI535_20720 [Citrobacter freundii]
MTAYILKTILCSAFFLGIYYLLLERAKMPRFNRAYLLLALVASFSIPLVTFTTEITVFPVGEIEFAGSPIQQTPLINVNQEPTRFNIIPFIIPAIYSLITILLLARFIGNITRLIILIENNSSILINSSRIILLRERVVPFSFFNYVFINEEEYAFGRIEPEVMCHEMEHGRQFHTVDIICIELLKAIAWFNPLLILYRKAIQLNHEFLADDAVVLRFNDPVSYQLLLVSRIGAAGRFFEVTSPFSYKITKKRLVMITNPFNKKANLARALALIPATALAIVLFSEKTLAQVTTPARVNSKTADTVKLPVVTFNQGDTTKKTNKTPAVSLPLYGGTTNGVSQDLLKEYRDLAESRKLLDGKGRGTYRAFTPEELARMKTIFSQMSKEQQVKQEVVFFEPMKPFKKTVPGADQMEAFLDAGKYGVWVDKKKISNSQLSRYSNTDFSYVTISKLYGKAKEGRSYTHQVNLMTNAEFEKMNAGIRASREPVMLVQVPYLQPKK